MKRPNTVRQLREALEMTQEEFGDALSITKARVSQMEADGASGERALKMAEKFRDKLHELDLDVEDLMRGRRAAA